MHKYDKSKEKQRRMEKYDISIIFKTERSRRRYQFGIFSVIDVPDGRD